MSFLKSLAGRQDKGRAEIRPMSDKRHSTYEPRYANMWLERLNEAADVNTLAVAVMKVVSTDLPEVLIVEPKLFGDQRGFFLETYQDQRYAEQGVAGPFVQDNLSRSSYGVLRGLHLQNPSTQGKLVSAMRGRVLDVAVDVRIGSPNFGRHVLVELNEDNRRQLWIPRGFAHGFVVLSETADFFYKCDNAYSPGDEIVVRWDDPAIGIQWGVEKPSLSVRDAAAPLLADVKNLPRYGQV